MTDSEKMTGYVSETGFLAGGLSVCAYTGPDCTGEIAALNDAAASFMANIYDPKQGFMKMVSWQVKEGGCLNE